MQIRVPCHDNLLHKLSNNCCYEIISLFFIDPTCNSSDLSI